MRAKHFLSIIFLGVLYSGWAQKIDLKLTNKVTVNRDSDYVYAYTLPEPSRFEADVNKMYYWYSGGTIKATRGGYEGKLLNGKFICFYHNKNLEEKGSFKKGIKTGKWLHWYKNGELKSIYHWKNGKLVGKSYHYDSLHQKLPTLKYRKGKAREKKRVEHFFNRPKNKIVKDSTQKSSSPKSKIKSEKKKEEVEKSKKSKKQEPKNRSMSNQQQNTSVPEKKKEKKAEIKDKVTPSPVSSPTKDSPPK